MPSIAVVGAGTMGSGIAQLAATCGDTVHLIDVNEETVQRGFDGIRQRYARAVEKGKQGKEESEAALARITTATSIADLGEVELAIEAVVESLEVKHDVFAELERAVPDSAVLATNTSSLSIGRIAEGVSDPRRVVGMHFFNPAPIMPLVEVVAGDRTEPSFADRAFETAKRWGKTPVRAKDTPGFIVNRVARGFYLEALRLLGEGVAGVDEIDQVMRNHGGFRMGPFELMDLVGVDVNLTVSESVWTQMGKPARLEPHEIQRRLVQEGHLGRKTRRGFYRYDGDGRVSAYVVDRRSFDISPLLKDAVGAFAVRAGASDAGGTEMYIFSRILAAILAEAGQALSDGVATGDDIDTAMIKGTNYPHGPLAWADRIGLQTVRGLLKNLASETEPGRYGIPAAFDASPAS